MISPGYTLRALVIADYDAVRILWEASEGVGLNESDSPEAIATFLQRNAGLSQVAVAASGEIVGAVLCGHDGRRGYLHHLAVSRAHRARGLGSALVDECLCQLRGRGIPKCNIFLFAANHAGRAFWAREGWAVRDDLLVMQRGLGGC
mgnify:CR=1 FL=1